MIGMIVPLDGSWKLEAASVIYTGRGSTVFTISPEAYDEIEGRTPRPGDVIKTLVCSNYGKYTRGRISRVWTCKCGCVRLEVFGVK